MPKGPKRTPSSRRHNRQTKPERDPRRTGGPGIVREGETDCGGTCWICEDCLNRDGRITPLVISTRGAVFGLCQPHRDERVTRVLGML